MTNPVPLKPIEAGQENKPKKSTQKDSATKSDTNSSAIQLPQDRFFLAPESKTENDRQMQPKGCPRMKPKMTTTRMRPTPSSNP